MHHMHIIAMDAPLQKRKEAIRHQNAGIIGLAKSQHEKNLVKLQFLSRGYMVKHDLTRLCNVSPTKMKKILKDYGISPNSKSKRPKFYFAPAVERIVFGESKAQPTQKEVARLSSVVGKYALVQKEKEKLVHAAESCLRHTENERERFIREVLPALLAKFKYAFEEHANVALLMIAMMKRSENGNGKALASNPKAKDWKPLLELSLQICDTLVKKSTIDLGAELTINRGYVQVVGESGALQEWRKKYGSGETGVVVTVSADPLFRAEAKPENKLECLPTADLAEIRRVMATTALFRPSVLEYERSMISRLKD